MKCRDLGNFLYHFDRLQEELENFGGDPNSEQLKFILMERIPSEKYKSEKLTAPSQKGLDAMIAFFHEISDRESIWKTSSNANAPKSEGKNNSFKINALMEEELNDMTEEEYVFALITKFGQFGSIKL